MQANDVKTPENTGEPPPPSAPDREVAPTPLTWRFGIVTCVVALGLSAYGLRDTIGPRGQAFVGVFCFFGLVAMFSSNLRAVNWRTIGWGMALQVVLAVLVLKVDFVHQGLEKAKIIVVNSINF